MFILFKHQNISTIGSIVDIHTIKYRAITFSIIIWDLMSKGLWLETFSTLAIRDNKMSKVRWIFYYLLNFLFWWVRMKKHICKPIRLFIDFMSSMRCELNLFWIMNAKGHLDFYCKQPCFVYYLLTIRPLIRKMNKNI